MTGHVASRLRSRFRSADSPPDQGSGLVALVGGLGRPHEPDRGSVEAEVARLFAVEAVRSEQPLLPMAEVEALAARRLGGNEWLGPSARYLAEDAVTEVLINGPGPIWVERDGKLVVTETEIGSYELDLLIERILMPLGLRVDRTCPVVDARLPDGSRVNVVIPPLAVDGPLVSIRRFGAEALSLSAFGPPPMISALEALMAERASILIVGPTSSGKTTLINALSGLVAGTERVLCLEDTAELRLTGDHVVRLEARPANSEGVGEVPMRTLVLNALRMRPDRLIVGEVRGPEAFDLLLALTSGHRGCLTSLHAADAAAGLRRLETLAALAGAPLGPARLRGLALDGLQAVVTMRRVAGERSVASVDRIDGAGLVNCWSVDDRPQPLRPPIPPPLRPGLRAEHSEHPGERPAC